MVCLKLTWLSDTLPQQKQTKQTSELQVLLVREWCVSVSLTLPALWFLTLGNGLNCLLLPMSLEPNLQSIIRPTFSNKVLNYLPQQGVSYVI